MERRTFSGVVRAEAATRLSFRVPGRIVAVGVDVGDAVRKGDVMARLDPMDYTLKKQEAEAALARAKAERRNADAGYARVRALYENGNASRNELDAARAAAESMEAVVASLRQQTGLAGRQLAFTRLKAPEDCAVAAVPVEAGENVAAGQAVCVVHYGAQPDVAMDLPAAHIRKVYEGMPVIVRVDEVGEPLSATVKEVGIAPVGMGTTFPVTIRMDAPDPRILPGMAAEVEMAFSAGKQAGRLLVPGKSVGEDRNGRFVFVLEAEDEGVAVVKRREVTVGRLSAAGLEIRSGLLAGEVVVTAGVSRIRDGLRVKFAEAGEDVL